MAKKYMTPGGAIACIIIQLLVIVGITIGVSHLIIGLVK